MIVKKYSLANTQNNIQKLHLNLFLQLSAVFLLLDMQNNKWIIFQDKSNYLLFVLHNRQ